MFLFEIDELLEAASHLFRTESQVGETLEQTSENNNNNNHDLNACTLDGYTLEYLKRQLLSRTHRASSNFSLFVTRSM